jgi:hypothetical protein
MLRQNAKDAAIQVSTAKAKNSKTIKTTSLNYLVDFGDSVQE